MPRRLSSLIIMTVRWLGTRGGSCQGRQQSLSFIFPGARADLLGRREQRGAKGGHPVCLHLSFRTKQHAGALLRDRGSCGYAVQPLLYFPSFISPSLQQQLCPKGFPAAGMPFQPRTEKECLRNLPLFDADDIKLFEPGRWTERKAHLPFPDGHRRWLLVPRGSAGARATLPPPQVQSPALGGGGRVGWRGEPGPVKCPGRGLCSSTLLL